MINTEFLTEFDVLYSNITSNQAPGLNAYEKSVFLTKAQSQLLQEYFNFRVDNSDGGFDGSPKRQIDFSKLTTWGTPTKYNGTKFDKRAIQYTLPKDVLYILDEQLFKSDNTAQYSVVPVSYEEYNRLMARPYKFPPKNQVWRLITNTIPVKKTEVKPVEYRETVPTTSYFNTTLSDIYEIQYQLKGSIENNGTKDVTLVLIFNYKMNNTYKKTIEENIKRINYNPNIICVFIDVETLEVTLDNINNSIAKTVPEFKVKITGFGESFSEELQDFYNKAVKDETTYAEKYISIVANIYAGKETITSCGIEIKETEEEDGEAMVVELIGHNLNSDLEYQLRYIRTPKPIILEDISDYGVSIQGFDTETECELPASMHHEILERAVTLAKIAWQGATATQAALAAQSNKQS